MDRVSLLLNVQDVAFSVGDRQLLKPVSLQ